MAGDVKVAVVSGAAPTGGGNQSFVGPVGFGTPKAAMFLATKDTSDDATSAAHVCISIGFTDGTNQFVESGQAEDNSASEDTNRGPMNDQVVGLLTTTGAIDGEAAFSSFTDRTVTINWGNAPSGAYLITCVMFGGDDLSAVAGSVLQSTSVGGTAVATTNIDQDLILFASTGSATFDAHSSNGNIFISFGACRTSATLVNKCFAWGVDQGSADGDPLACSQLSHE